MHFTKIFFLPVVVAFILAFGTAKAQPDIAAISKLWAESAHADAGSLAFTRWNEEGEIPAACAVCHSGAGFRDFHGIDGTAAGQVDGMIATGGVVDCDTCHAPGVREIGAVGFPSGVTLSIEPAEATCSTCHQGRASGARIAGLVDGKDPDAVDPELSFVNPHYVVAAATLNGADAGGLYAYAGRLYAGRAIHAPEVDGCTGCHEPHGLEVALETCASCHETSDPRAIRVGGRDADGDGDVTEGVASEVRALLDRLEGAILTYAREVAGVPLVHAPTTHPYFFKDLDGDGAASEAEAVRDNAYASWTPRLLAAAYNFRFIASDPGAYVHNPRYALQGLLDSIEDLTGEAPAENARP